MSTGCGNSRGVPYSYCLVTESSHRAVFQWQLSRVFTCATDAILTSPPFKVGNGVWKVNLWPHGREECDEGFMSIFLSLEEGPDVKAKFKFVIKSRDGDVFTLESGTDLAVFAKHVSWGYGKFVHKRFLINTRERFYEDNVLELEIDVEIHRPHGTNSQLDNHPQRNPVEQDGQQECVICLATHVTSGLVHGFTCHKCVCEECAMKYIERPNQMCPVCRVKVDKVILRFY